MSHCSNLKVDHYLIQQIRDYAYGTPENNYKNTIKELKKVYCHPICGYNCRYKVTFVDGSFLRRPFIINQVHKKCTRCLTGKLSTVDHAVEESSMPLPV